MMTRSLRRAWRLCYHGDYMLYGRFLEIESIAHGVLLEA